MHQSFILTGFQPEPLFASEMDGFHVITRLSPETAFASFLVTFALLCAVIMLLLAIAALYASGPFSALAARFNPAKRRRIAARMMTYALSIWSVSELSEMLFLSLSAKATLMAFASAIGLWLTGKTFLGVFQITPRPVIQGLENGELSFEDQALYERLESAIHLDKMFLSEGLKASEMAGAIGVSEHRLRSFINKTLGYRNFNAYLNGARIAQVKEQMADPRHIDTPMMTLAFTNGFSSVSAFNRAFRKKCGMSPTQYRESLFGKPEK